ncbi:MAG TPA: TadE/TadG family type IV pilus assembly protein [Frankiaceae bacterium]|nr:TadE/TadG family type IV pilus assembly protein [Frankiaceae bacterium]
MNQRVAAAPNKRITDEGAAVVEFVLISGLLLLLVLGVVQLALVLHTRNVLSADAAEGARHGANLDRSEASGGPYAQELMRRSVPGAARGISCAGHSETGAAGVPQVAVTCAGSIRLTLVPLGPRLDMSVTGRAVKETT